MADSKRLKELLKQKDLVEQHLAWIDQEIAKESYQASPEPSSPIPENRLEMADSANDPKATDQPNLSDAQAASDLYSELGPDTKSSVQSTKTGCMIFFAIGILVLGGLVALTYYIY